MRGPRGGAGSRVGGGPSSSDVSWTPAHLSNLLGIFDPLIGLTLVSTTHVSAWQDARGSVGPTVAQSTDASRPTVDASVQFGGGPTIKFDGAANSGAGQTLSVNTGGVTGNASHTEYLVARWDISSGSYKQMMALGQVGTSSGIGTTDPTGGEGNTWWGGGSGKITPRGKLPNSTGAGPAANTIHPDQSVFHLICKVFDSATSTVRIYVDGYLVGVATSVTYSLVAGLGFFPHAAGNMNSDHAAYAFACSGAHDVTARRQVERWARKRFGSTLGNAQALPSQLLGCGDSLTHGTGATAGTDDYLTQLGALLGTSPTVWNMGVPSMPITSAQTQVETDVAGHVTGLAGRTAIVVWQGVNDLYGNNATPNYWTTAYANLLTYVASIKALAPGAPVAVCTLHHATGIVNPATYNPYVDSYNALVRAGAAAGGYSVADLAADDRLDLSLHPERSADGLHFDSTGYGYVAADIAAVIGGWT